ncbi:MAG: vanadium-dependent haloperoxidase [Saprospiraceae bacterium]|nr:vanadium-dependent haloperoxidase [Saprospiraceae bacterium]
MHRSLILLLLLFMAGSLAAQQSNKSKSKDRYREKDQPSRQEVATSVDRYGVLRAHAEQQLRPVVFTVSDVLLRDGLSGPAASRVLAYSLLAGYETTARYQSRVSSLHDALRGMPMMLSFTPGDSVFYPYASLFAILEAGRQLAPSGYLIASNQNMLQQYFRQQGLQEAYIRHSETAARDIARLVVDYANADGSARLASYPPYPTESAPERWAPPGNLAPQDPYWSYLRPFFLETAQQFASASPVPAALQADSPFAGLAREVYDQSRSLVPEQTAVAQFWAGDPAAYPQAGLGRLTPAAHWLNIGGLLCAQQKLSFIQSLKVQTILALTLADAEIACWSDKYRQQRIRPQAAINRLFDPNWRPVLAEPAYPAGLSQQAVLGAAAAELLTRMLGDNLPLTDNTEQAYGVNPRQYPSVRIAAEEAAWSRLFAGLQFRDGILAGQDTGRKVANWALSKWPAGL